LTRQAKFIYLPVGMKKQAPRPSRSQDTRQAIHAAATTLFAEKGYAGTSIREICARAGITKPALYYYFGNKEQLYQELILDAFNEYRKKLLSASRQGRTAREKIVNLLEAMFTFTLQRPELIRLAFRMLLTPEKTSPQIDYVELGQFDQRLMRELIREGIKNGELKGNPQEIAEALSGIATLHILDFLVSQKAVLDRARARRQVDLLFNGCKSTYTKR
jgi:AcrR family transcriptional regulator